MRAKSDAILKGIQVNIEVDGEAWTRVGSFKESGPEDRHYLVKKEEDGSTVIIFGDGEKGQRPPPGSVITVRYRDGGGASGNVSRKRLKISFSWDGRC
jgi:hypothetical protein